MGSRKWVYTSWFAHYLSQNFSTLPQSFHLTIFHSNEIRDVKVLEEFYKVLTVQHPSQRLRAWGWFHWWSLQTLDIFKQKRMCEKFHPFCSTVGFEWRTASLKGSLMKILWNATIKHLLSIYNVISTLNIYWVSTIYLLCVAVHGVAKSQTRLSDWIELNNVIPSRQGGRHR